MNQKTKRENLTKTENTNFYGLSLKSFYDYEIIQELPAGGAEADNFLIQKNQQKFFLKLYRKGINPNIDLLKNLKELSQKLKEHVVEIYDVGFDNQLQRYYEIMEFVPFGDLRELIKEIQSLSENKKHQQIDLIIKEMAHALHFLHSHDIIHRDLKPSNILIRNKDPLDLVFIDFGISKQLNEDLSKIATSSFKGTIYYIAPEEISNYFGKEIDWWHFGVIIYELLTGKNPFAKLSEHNVINLLTTKGIEIPKTIPQKYQVLLKGLLTRDYEKRWGYNQIQDWLEGKNVDSYYKEIKTQDIWEQWGIPENSPWRKFNIDPEIVLSFKNEDFGINEARKWIQAGWKDGKHARSWFFNGFEPDEATTLEKLGLSAKQAKLLINDGMTIQDLIEIKKSVPNFDHLIRKAITYIQQGFKISDFLKNYKSWNQAGFNFEKAILYLKEGLKLNEVIEWKNLLRNNDSRNAYSELQKWIQKGFTAIQALEWKKAKFSVKVASKWRKTNLSPEQARQWLRAGFNPNQAKSWIDAGFSLNEAKSWSTSGISSPIEAKEWEYRGFKAYKTRDWIELNINAIQAKELSSYNQTPDDVSQWLKYGFTIDEILYYLKHHFSLWKARRWHEYGFSPDLAVKLYHKGITAEEAIEADSLGMDLERYTAFSSRYDEFKQELKKRRILSGITNRLRRRDN